MALLRHLAVVRPRLAGFPCRTCRPTVPKLTCARKFQSASDAEKAPGNKVRHEFDDAVVLPIPGILLTNEIFTAVSLNTALATQHIDTDIGLLSSASEETVGMAANRAFSEFVQRYGLRKKAVIVGHSYGGYLALEFAKRFPEMVAGIVLISTQCRADTPGSGARREKTIKQVAIGGMDAVLDGMFPGLLSKKTIKDEGIKDSIKTMAKSIGTEAFIRQQRSSAARPDQRDGLTKLPAKIPIIVCAGKEDKLTPAVCAKEMRQLLQLRKATIGETSPWRIVVCENTGHLLPLEQPQILHDHLANWAEEVRAASLQTNVKNVNDTTQ